MKKAKANPKEMNIEKTPAPAEGVFSSPDKFSEADSSADGPLSEKAVVSSATCGGLSFSSVNSAEYAADPSSRDILTRYISGFIFPVSI
jgi:hypothetical protein